MGKAAYLRTDLWQATRLRVFKRDGYRCAKCGKAGRLECHHIKPLYKHPEQDPYALDGLLSVCRSCHIKITREEREGDRAKVNPYSQLINKLKDV